MKKSRIIKIFFLIAVLAMIFALAACDSSSTPKGYVEVETLRIDSANVYLSPAGETAQKQLEVEILPANATNRKLIYYIPSEYLKYVKVSQTGLIEALLPTEEDMSVPLTVSSSTNAKAKLQVNVVVEYVAVKEVHFTETELTMLYKDVGKQLSVTYVPYHAQDGRAVTFSSLNTEIATVTATGLVEPSEKVGDTHIVATCRTSEGRTVIGRIPVTVKYEKGRYRLEVSDPNAEFKQTLGEFKPIKFVLTILNEKSDPNPKIQWFVDTERVLGMEGYTEYEHTPNVSTRTSYKVRVKVTPTGDIEQTLESEDIHIYNKFAGFDVKIDNIAEKNGYQYGDIATFSVNIAQSSVEYYEWYLKKQNTAEQGILVGVTTVENKDLTKRLNIEGDFKIYAVGKDSDNNSYTPQEFDFSVTRFNIGDTIILQPKLLQYGIPPESYTWYEYKLDSSGNRVGEWKSVGDGQPFYYSLTSNGNIELVAYAVLEGVVAKVDNVEFEGSSNILRVYGVSDGAFDGQYAEDILTDSNFDYKYSVVNKQKVKNVVIEGVDKNGQVLVNIHWENSGANKQYVVEITKNDKVYLLDSTEYSTLKSNYLHVPSNIVTLSDKFTVRIKEKGGLFSERYHYNYVNSNEEMAEFYFDKISDTQYSYLKNIYQNINGYINNMKELGEVLNYIMLYRPNNNSLVTYTIIDASKQRYSVDLNIKIQYTQELAEKYPVDGEYADIYKMLIGAQKSYCESGDYTFSVTEILPNCYTISIVIPNEIKNLQSTDLEKDITSYSSTNYSAQPYGVSKTEFIVDGRDDYNVKTSDQLYTLLQQGKRPLPSEDSLWSLYNVAKSVVKSIISEDMSDAQKVLAFFDYLVINTSYDTKISQLIEDNTANMYNYDSFHLEGVFFGKKGVCDGIAKAMSLLCAIEGIYCVKVTGTVDGVGHSWNQVLIDGNYYFLDATYGIKKVQVADNFYNVANHKYFLMTTAQFFSYYNEVVIFGEYHTTDVEYDMSITVSDSQQMTDFLASFDQDFVCVELKIVGQTVQQIMDNVEIFGSEISYFLLSDNRVVVFVSKIAS